MAVRWATSSAGRLFFSPFGILLSNCADIVEMRTDIRLFLAIYTAAVYIYRCREGTGIETAPQGNRARQVGRKCTGPVASRSRGSATLRGEGFNHPSGIATPLTCSETRVRFPRRPDSSKKIAPGWLKCRGNRCGRYLGKSRYRPHRHISAVRLGRHLGNERLRWTQAGNLSRAD